MEYVQVTCEVIQSLGTDWWSVGATIISGIIASISTILAVVYTNHKSNKQLIKQEEKFKLEQKKNFQQSKYVVLKPSLLLTTFEGLHDRVIVANDYNRVLLYSSNDGFDFYDNLEKRYSQTCRALLIENKSENDVNGVSLHTNTILHNMSTDEETIYETQNYASFLRSQESIVIRLTNQEQYESILNMNKKNTPNYLKFECIIDYWTLANQHLQYIYRIKIDNDKHIEIENDSIQLIESDVIPPEKDPTIFRNLQDSISSVDRSKYAWTKMGMVMSDVLVSRNLLQTTPQNIINNDNSKENKENSEI